jgi:hypothetical protein
LNEWLNARGFSLRNLSSISDQVKEALHVLFYSSMKSERDFVGVDVESNMFYCQTVAGAIGTGTHATGVNFGILATEIVEIELITAQVYPLKQNESLITYFIY